MATLAGGATISSVGLTAAENNAVSQILQSTFSQVSTATTVTVVAGSGTVTTMPVLVGTFSADSVQNTSVDGGSSGFALVSLPSSTSNTKSITNLVADNSLSGAVLTGSGNSNVVTGFIGGTNTSLVVGNAGTEIVDLSRSTQNATIVSGTGNDTVLSGSGNDQVQLGGFGVANGGSGADTLIGGAGEATLGGGAGADSIVAASGGGVLIGETGNDTLVGGAGKDIFIYTSGGGNDLITGFDVSQDTIGLANLSDLSAAGWSVLDVISRATVSGGNTILSMPDGSTITVAGVTGINISWFTVK